ncbi:Lateral flagellin [Pseudomonas stutzeri]|uniref:flagellin N-terminal helical domain-containing protein n=1 Tax=Stutzerimonas stutzeri TaxID=316 RepID=UPI0021086D6A|nr:flagellin [Stutzerimonas stutzeri]MCQ4309523.1 Lateral flagellin [Stutzerimonas stutzeri]
MALSIHTNYSALTTNTALNKSNNALATNQQRLGTGLRINSAADDAAGLQIATRLNAQSRGMGVAMRNVGDATSMLQTAEGAFSEMTDIMQRMKDLATQGANGTNSTDDLKALQAEYSELGKELGNIIKNTKYAGERLFSDGANVDGQSGKFGKAEAVDAADYKGVVFQIGASSEEALKLDVSARLKTVADALTAASDAYAGVTHDPTETDADAITTGFLVHTHDHDTDAATPDAVINNASNAIGLLETALNEVGSLRSEFGATINRLNHTSNNLANMKDNTEMAKGRIMDADFAMESANMSKNSMLMQSGISMLKQAGQMPGMVMGLLG